MFSESRFLSQVYVNLLYPMSAVSFCYSTYMTLAITVERFIAVCRPHQFRNISQVRFLYFDLDKSFNITGKSI